MPRGAIEPPTRGFSVLLCCSTGGGSRGRDGRGWPPLAVVFAHGLPMDDGRADHMLGHQVVVVSPAAEGDEEWRRRESNTSRGDGKPHAGRALHSCPLETPNVLAASHGVWMLPLAPCSTASRHKMGTSGPVIWKRELGFRSDANLCSPLRGPSASSAAVQSRTSDVRDHRTRTRADLSAGREQFLQAAEARVTVAPHILGLGGKPVVARSPQRGYASSRGQSG